MKRALWSLVIGGFSVAAIWIIAVALNHSGKDHLFPDCLLWPSLYLSINVPDSHFDGVTNSHAGPISTLVFFAANSVIYCAAIYLILSPVTLLLNRFRTRSITHIR